MILLLPTTIGTQRETTEQPNNRRTEQPKNREQQIKEEMTTTIDTRNFLKWTSIAIQIENPNITKSNSIKKAIKELQKEKKMRNYIRVYSLKYQKENPNISKKESIKEAIKALKTNN